MRIDSWDSRAAQKRRQCAAKIPGHWKVPVSILHDLHEPLQDNRNNLLELDIVRRCGIMTERELRITESFTVKSLLEALASGELTSLEVTIAYSKRAAIAQQLKKVNCLTETFFAEAEARARSLDDMRAKGQLAGPLHGLPISLKDSFQVAGTQATLGIVSFLDEVSDSNSALVDILLELGAALYVKTNVPQTLGTVDSENNVFGRTLNPWNTMLTPGGSSGGEGALVALQGSPLGIGTDLGGSVRIPSLCCGVYGFKPTASRLPYGGQQSLNAPGTDFMLACAGPISRDLKALEVLVKVVIDARPALYDSTAIGVPWRDVSKLEKCKLRIGVVPEDPLFPSHPPVRNTMDEAVRILRSKGMELIYLDPGECHVADATEVAWKFFGLDETVFSHLKASGEPAVRSVAFINSLAAALPRKFLPDTSGMDKFRLLATLRHARAAISEDWRKMWQSNALDVVLC
ncbi:general amidase-B [Lasiodiplodia theobromae]|uniref:amidase n=1 Tax=Lasiodiplodia theobromae TaxID=45133 RepID=A0A8H7MB71_9PEZI|nr:general amidase-B [Lasiodiplodia theobromae]